MTVRPCAPFPLLIAETACSHGGDTAYFDELVDRLAAGKAEAVKIQPVRAREFLSPRHSMLSVFKGVELPVEVMVAAVKRLHAAGKRAAFDVFGFESLAIALEAGADVLKVHATDFDDPALVAAVLDTGLPALLSTGGATEAEMDKVVGATRGHKAPVCLLVGFQSFPTPVQEANVGRIGLLAERYGLPVGFMDHVDRDDPFAMVLPCVALAHGACCVEKHTFLAESDTRYDRESALDPEEIDRLHDLMEKTLAAQGRAHLKLSELERAYMLKARRMAVAAADLREGRELAAEDVEFLRVEAPETEHPLTRAELAPLLGRRLARTLAAGDAITVEALE